ncbi:MAG: RsmB/NOP family class I SAM-dependent RNA methyltransferase [Promethearchaeota archaeon]
MSIDRMKLREIAEDTGYSPFMVQELIKNYPDDYQAVIRGFDKPPLNTIRVNTLKTTPDLVKQRLKEKNFDLRPAPWIKNAFHVNTTEANFTLGATHEYLMGYYYLQSLASMVPVEFLYPMPDDKVLDMCAAPGSKTTQIGQMMQQRGQIVAVDNKITRLRALASNIRRCGIQNCILFQNDAAQLYKNIGTKFFPNKILLDAPCSGSGIIRIDRTRKHVKNDNNIRRLAQIQKQLLRNGLNLLQSGGYLVYSTCSFHYQENEQVIAETLKNFKDVEIVEPAEDIGLPGLEHVGNIEFGYDMLKTRRLSPNIHDTDAFFICLLHKN